MLLQWIIDPILYRNHPHFKDKLELAVNDTVWINVIQMLEKHYVGFSSVRAWVKNTDAAKGLLCYVFLSV